MSSQEVHCGLHQEVLAQGHCDLCETPVCGTCAFRFDFDSYCPGCVLRATQLERQDNWRRTLPWVTASVATVLSGVVVLAMLASVGDESVGCLFFVMVGGCFAGLIVADGGRQGRTRSDWTALFWNLGILLAWGLMAVIGMALQEA